MAYFITEECISCGACELNVLLKLYLQETKIRN